MSFYISNDHEILGQFASNTGYDDLIQAAEPEEDLLALNSLIEHGVSEDVPAVVADLDRLLKMSLDDSPEAVAVKLRNLIKDQDLIVVTDG